MTTSTKKLTLLIVVVIGIIGAWLGLSFSFENAPLAAKQNPLAVSVPSEAFAPSMDLVQPSGNNARTETGSNQTVTVHEESATTEPTGLKADPYVDHPGPFSPTLWGLKGFPRDPIEQGPHTLTVIVSDRATGEALDSYIQLWRTDAPATLTHSEGAQLVTRDRGKDGEHELKNLAAGRYLVVVMDAVEGSPLPDLIDLAGDTSIHIRVQVPRSFDIHVALVRTGGNFVPTVNGHLSRMKSRGLGFRPEGLGFRINQGFEGTSEKRAMKYGTTARIRRNEPELKAGPLGYFFEGLEENTRESRWAIRLVGIAPCGDRFSVQLPTSALADDETERKAVAAIFVKNELERGFLAPDKTWADPEEWSFRTRRIAVTLDRGQRWQSSWVDAPIQVIPGHRHKKAAETSVTLGQLPLVHASVPLYPRLPRS